jgi:mannobiose 2-epimerase
MFSTERIDTAALKGEFKKELQTNILPYWMNRMVDLENGGFYGRRDGYDHLEAKADKAIILNTRILWTFSHAAYAFGDSNYRRVADRAYHYITRYFVDPEFHGVFWMVDFQGNPVATKKQVCAQAFAIYAFAEYFKASNKRESLEHAIDLFRLIENNSFDKKENGYLEAFDRDWKLLEDLRLSDKDANEKKTMNTHLHVLEAYTTLYRIWKDPFLAKQLRNLILVFRDKIVSDTKHFNLFFDEHWYVKSHEISFGHDIEGSWLLYEAAEALADENLKTEIRQLCLDMVEETYQYGFDDDGGLMNEANAKGMIDADKHWWPQAEALVGLVNAWQLSADDKYLEMAIRNWRFIQNTLIDRENGEWFWRVNRRGAVNRDKDKSGPWKCPYHNGRAMLELMNRLP